MRSRKIPLIVKVGAPEPVEEAGSSAQRSTNSTPGKADVNSTSRAVGDSLENRKDIITISEAKEYFDSKQAIFIDARSEQTYSGGHIPGSINVPFDKLADYYDMLTSSIPTEQLVICYCWSPSCEFSDNLASELRLMGYEKVLIFKGGWEEWTDKGYPTESGKLDSNG